MWSSWHWPTIRYLHITLIFLLNLLCTVVNYIIFVQNIMNCVTDTPLGKVNVHYHTCLPVEYMCPPYPYPWTASLTTAVLHYPALTAHTLLPPTANIKLNFTLTKLKNFIILKDPPEYSIVPKDFFLKDFLPNSDIQIIPMWCFLKYFLRPRDLAKTRFDCLNKYLLCWKWRPEF